MHYVCIINIMRNRQGQSASSGSYKGRRKKNNSCRTTSGNVGL